MSNEQVHFRLIVMPCCNHQLCWVNPRLPTYCPECGTNIFERVRSAVTFTDTRATLKIHELKKPPEPKIEGKNLGKYSSSEAILIFNRGAPCLNCNCSDEDRATCEAW